ncbi:Imm10 family immunity protein [Streptomyces sp. NPDC001339]|uniref:Imm10 family immunity protein n=1 Tax=Streptomyces sp. NPDC001339 TaxID=3364563 RepID=UPI0036953847
MTTQPPTMQIDTVVVEENEPDECFTVGMAEQQGEGHQLIIQISLYEPDDQDEQLGLDTYCVMAESGATHYGGIEEAVLTGNTLRLSFTEEATSGLGLPSPSLTLHLDVPDDDVAALASGLRRALTYGNPEQHPQHIELT